MLVSAVVMAGFLVWLVYAVAAPEKPGGRKER